MDEASGSCGGGGAGAGCGAGGGAGGSGEASRHTTRPSTATGGGGETAAPSRQGSARVRTTTSTAQIFALSGGGGGSGGPSCRSSRATSARPSRPQTAKSSASSCGGGGGRGGGGSRPMSSQVSGRYGGASRRQPAGSPPTLPGVPSSGPPRKVAYHEAVRLALGSLQLVDSYQGDGLVAEPAMTTNARVRPGSGRPGARPAAPAVVASAQYSRRSSADLERGDGPGRSFDGGKSQPSMGAPGSRAVLAAAEAPAAAPAGQ